jgi:3-phenylpropionate/trans-cinnamate dioxygenase ferredoxin reductase component
MHGVVIVGAGECGVRAAFALREAGYDGAIRLLGEEPHLPYERPPLSKGHPVAAKHIASEAAFAEADIELMRGERVVAIEPRVRSVRLTNETALPYGKLLIATGARARRFPGMEAALTLRTLDDAGQILNAVTAGKRLAIVGGGFIGLELAATARRMGAEVTVVEAVPRLMGRAVPAEIAAVAQARHLAEGVELVLGAQVESVAKDKVVLVDGRIIHSDIVVAGVGAVPETSLAEAGGLTIANGIAVDSAFRTSAPNIFAAGDCCAFPYRGRHVRLESWRAAQDHGNHVARAMLGDETPYAKAPWFWSDQYDLTLQVAGLPDPGAETVRRDLGDDAFVLFQAAADGTLQAAAGIGPGNAVARDVRLAEMIIERGLAPDPTLLADPSFSLKQLLRN